MRIIGSGVDVTTLKLASSSLTDQHRFAIGHKLSSGGQPNTVDYFEVSNLTVDCNFGGQTGAKVAAGAVRIMGNHVGVRRIKVKNWGTRGSGWPCFAIAVITADPASGVNGVTDAGIEECLVVQPGSNTTGEVTLLHVGGKVNAATNTEGFGLGCYIRNCFVDCAPVDFSKDFRALSMGWCKTGVIEGNQVQNTKYGGPFQQKTSAQGMVVRGNFYRNVRKGPVLGALGDPPSGTGSLSRSGTLATVTWNGHGFIVGDRVKLDTTPNDFDGVVEVTIVTTNTFKFNTSVTGPTSATVSSAQKVFGVKRLVLEGNTVELASETSGELIAIDVADRAAAMDPNYPAYAFDEVMIRDNRIRYVDGAFESNYVGYGVQVSGAEQVQVRNNVVESAPAHPIRNARCGSAQYLENRTPVGVLVRGYDESTGFLCNELETDVEDAFILGWLRNK